MFNVPIQLEYNQIKLLYEQKSNSHATYLHITNFVKDINNNTLPLNYI